MNIVVCADTRRGLEATVDSSLFPAIQNLLLAATALNLGSALTTITTGYRAELQAIVGLPDEVWPVEPPVCGRRRCFRVRGPPPEKAVVADAVLAAPRVAVASPATESVATPTATRPRRR